MNEGGRLLRAVKVPSKILDVPLNRETLTTSRYCFPEVLNVKVSSSLGYFMHGGADEKPENVTCQDMATADYLECCHLQRPGKGPYYYFTSPLNSPSLSAFSNVTNRRWWLKTKHFFPSPSALLPSIWIGGLGTDTRTHYDLRDNFLFNAYGRKRVRVWSPRSCFENFVMFPGWFFLLLLFACPCLSPRWPSPLGAEKEGKCFASALILTSTLCLFLARFLPLHQKGSVIVFSSVVVGLFVPPPARRRYRRKRGNCNTSILPSSLCRPAARAACFWPM